MKYAIAIQLNVNNSSRCYLDIYVTISTLHASHIRMNDFNATFYGLFLRTSFDFTLNRMYEHYFFQVVTIFTARILQRIGLYSVARAYGRRDGKTRTVHKISSALSSSATRFDTSQANNADAKIVRTTKHQQHTLRQSGKKCDQIDQVRKTPNEIGEINKSPFCDK